MKAELVPLNGDAPIPITRDLTVVGRREFCDVVVPIPGLSKQHCLIVRTDGLMMLRDLATTNGTKVNGQRVTWAALLPNDRVTLGGYKVRVYLGSDEALSPSELYARGLPMPPAFQTAGAVRPAPAPASARPGVAIAAKPAVAPPMALPADDDDDDDDAIIQIDSDSILDDDDSDELIELS